jgi:tetraacyldisaccharide 4'-kinase
MKAPAWWDAPLRAQALALAPFGLLYGLATAARMGLARGIAPGVPVICVGNFTLGGAGKTPVTIALARRLSAMGRRPVILSRGHGGRVRGPHAVDLARDTAEDVGDEPVLLARHAPVIVGADRVAGARRAIEDGADVLLMDDGLQNPALAKTLSLAVVDGGSGIGNGMCFPAGPLRAPLGGQLRHVQAVATIGDGAPGAAVAARAIAAGVPLLRARLAPTPEAAAFAGARLLGFCGIGRPEKFRATLAGIGADVVAFRAFPDHHPFTPLEARALVEEAARGGLSLVTTEKDQARLLASPATLGALAGAANVVRVEAVFEDEAALDVLLARALSAAPTLRGGA